jgi:hypothetical protein
VYLNTPYSLSCGIADVKTGLKLVEDCLWETLCHDVDILQICGHMNYAECHKFTNKVDVYLNMLCPSMVNRVVGEVHSRHIVALDDSSLVNIHVELLKKMAQPVRLGRGIGNATVVCFDARTGNHCLPLGGPGYQCVTEEHIVARHGTSRVRAASPVSVGGGHHGCAQQRMDVDAM